MRGKVTESLVRADGVVDAFPSPEIAIEGGELKRVGDDFIKFLGMGTLGALDMAVEFGRAGRQNEFATANRPMRTRGVGRTRRSCWWRCGCTPTRWG